MSDQSGPLSVSLAYCRHWHLIHARPMIDGAWIPEFEPCPDCAAEAAAAEDADP